MASVSMVSATCPSGLEGAHLRRRWRCADDHRFVVPEKPDRDHPGVPIESGVGETGQRRRAEKLLSARVVQLIDDLSWVHVASSTQSGIDLAAPREPALGRLCDYSVILR